MGSKRSTDPRASKSRQASVNPKAGKILLVGADPKQILQKRFMTAGYKVIAVTDDTAAIEFARPESLTRAAVGVERIVD